MMIPPSRSKDMLDCIQLQIAEQSTGGNTEGYILHGFTLPQLVLVADFITSFACTTSEYDNALCAQMLTIHHAVYPNGDSVASQQPNSGS